MGAYLYALGASLGYPVSWELYYMGKAEKIDHTTTEGKVGKIYLVKEKVYKEVKNENRKEKSAAHNWRMDPQTKLRVEY